MCVIYVCHTGIEESHRKGKISSLIGVEGGHSIGTSLGVLRMLYQLGARYLTLTHTCNTPWADCCKVDEPGQVPHIGGLSHFGTVSYLARKIYFRLVVALSQTFTATAPPLYSLDPARPGYRLDPALITLASSFISSASRPPLTCDACACCFFAARS